MATENRARLHSKFWFVYLALATIAVAINLLTAAFDPENTKAGHVVGIVISLAGLIPLYGFARERRINPRWLWQLVLVVAALGTLAAVGICVVTAFANSALAPAFLAVAIAGMCTPYLFAVYHYTFRNPSLWQ